MTNSRIPETKLRKLRKLAVAYYEMQHEIAREYLDPWINPATYTVDGVLDMDAYRQALLDLEEYTYDTNMMADAKWPTDIEPDAVYQVQMFGYYNFEVRARLRKIGRDA